MEPGHTLSPTDLCRSKDPSLPEEWRVYLYEELPRRSLTATHMQLTGASTRICRRGHKKGKRIWCKPWQEQKSFLFSTEEWDSFFCEGGSANNHKTEEEL